MQRLKKQQNILQKKWEIIVPIVIVTILAISFWYGGDVPQSQKLNSETSQNQTEVQTDDKIEILDKEEPKAEDKAEHNIDASTQDEKIDYSLDVPLDDEKSQNEQADISETILDVTDKNLSEEKQKEQVSEEPNPSPVEPENTEMTENELTCTLIVRCDTLLNNLDSLNAEKIDLVPQDGIIFSANDVVFYEGESAFNVLLREMKVNKIHMEYADTPLYNSAYIEGIENLYEFDCGELSGWMYKVNDWFPNYGCSRYVLSDGDIIEFVYTCDLGNDVGGGMTVSEQYEG